MIYEQAELLATTLDLGGHLYAGHENGQQENGAAEETNERASLYATPTRFVCPRKLCFWRDDVDSGTGGRRRDARKRQNRRESEV